ncbi:MAG: hypothetical protein ABMA01_10380 [Chthoniobacteraceae bacterium]
MGTTWSCLWIEPICHDVPNKGPGDLTDPFNGSPAFFWPPLDASGGATTLTYPMDADNHAYTFTSAAYYTAWQDTDNDGIPDVADPYPNDYYNGNDTDSDGIPDSIEVQYSLNPNLAADAGTVRTINGQTEGLTWKQAYDTGYMNSFYDDGLDDDADGMSNLYEILNGLDRHIATDAVDAPVGHLEAGATATMNDFILNIEKFSPAFRSPTSSPTAWSMTPSPGTPTATHSRI